MSKLKTAFVGLLVGGLALIVLSMGFLYSFRSSVGGGLSNALIVKTQQVHEIVVHDGETPGPVVVHTTPKPNPTPGKIFRPISSPVPQNSSFPACYREATWFYGWHGTSFEPGTDFDCGYRTNVPALWGGTVVGAYRTCWDSSCSSSSGGVVIVRSVVTGIGTHDTYYLHLDAVNVYAGEGVSKGQLLGWTGGCIGYGHWITSRWFTTGCHLEIGMDAAFLPHISYNLNPFPYINQALNSQ